MTELRDPARLYESLARYQWFRRRLAGRKAGAGLEIHKRLLPPKNGTPGPDAGVAALNQWLLSLLTLPAGSHVLDIGCGFGGTLLAWAKERPGSYTGLSNSPFQLQQAEKQARLLGLEGCLGFRLQSFDAPISGKFDGIVSVETLFHAVDLKRTLANLARCTRRGGQLLLLEDMAAGEDTNAAPHAAELLRCWSSPTLHEVEDYKRALSAAGYRLEREIDISNQVAVRTAELLAKQRRRLHGLRMFAPTAGLRFVLDAFLGGLALEQLYGQRLMRYRVMLASLGGGAK